MLLKNCDHLVKMETTKEEIMDDAELVNSTTDCEPPPVKKSVDQEGHDGRSERKSESTVFFM